MIELLVSKGHYGGLRRYRIYCEDMAYTYRPPILTVDAVVFQLLDNELNVLLVRRADEPFKGEWALVGGYNAAGDTTIQALNRVLKAKANLTTDNLSLIEQLHTFDNIGRDPRGHTVSVTYMGLVKAIEIEPTKTTQDPKFFPVTRLPKLAYDHDEIIRMAHDRLRSMINNTNAVFSLLPEVFTLTRLQTAYEAILGHPLDKRNFRKKFLSFDMIEPTDKYQQDGAHRPAQLYRFKRQELQSLVRSFD